MIEIMEFQTQIQNRVDKYLAQANFTFFTNRFSKDTESIFQYFLLGIETIRNDVSDFCRSREFGDVLDFSNEDIREVLNYLSSQVINSSYKVIQSIVHTHFAYRINKMAKYKEQDIKSYDDFINNFSETSNSSYWYRGNTKKDYELLPSIYRDTLLDTDFFTLSRIESDYVDKGLWKKLQNALGSVSLKYNEIAFIQHSIGYSPLLDFTKNHFVSLAFCLSNFIDIASFFHHAGAIFKLDVDGLNIIDNFKDADNAVKSQEAEVLKGKPYISSIIKSKMWDRLVFRHEESTVHLIDVVTNDRMRYQKGTFLLFDKILVVGNRMLMSDRKESFMSSRITKYNIKKSIKFYDDFQKNKPQYQIRYLMNPYQYFVE